MYVSFPNPLDVAKMMNSSGGQCACNSGDAKDAVERALRIFQRLTIMALADTLDAASIQIARRRETVTPEDLRTQANALREYATRIEAGQPLPPSPADDGERTETVYGGSELHPRHDHRCAVYSFEDCNCGLAAALAGAQEEKIG